MIIFFSNYLGRNFVSLMFEGISRKLFSFFLFYLSRGKDTAYDDNLRLFVNSSIIIFKAYNPLHPSFSSSKADDICLPRCSVFFFSFFFHNTHSFIYLISFTTNCRWRETQLSVSPYLHLLVYCSWLSSPLHNSPLFIAIIFTINSSEAELQGEDLSPVHARAHARTRSSAARICFQGLEGVLGAKIMSSSVPTGGGVGNNTLTRT